MPRPALAQGPRPRTLPPGILVEDVADRSRQALVAFLRLRHGDAERPELASWLFGPYLEALTIGRIAAAATEPTIVVEHAAPGETVAAVIAKATRAIEQVLAAFQQDPDLSIAPRLIERRVIEPFVDERGSVGYGPLGGASMPLNVRVLALAATEMLTRPDRLRADLVVGPESVMIADRPVVSGVALRSRQTLPWAPARDERNREAGWPARSPTLADLVAAQDTPVADES